MNYLLINIFIIKLSLDFLMIYKFNKENINKCQVILTRLNKCPKIN